MVHVDLTCRRMGSECCTWPEGHSFGLRAKLQDGKRSAVPHRADPGGIWRPCGARRVSLSSLRSAALSAPYGSVGGRAARYLRKSSGKCLSPVCFW